MQFMVTAMDFKDPGAIERRMANRTAHIRGVRKMIENGQFLSGGAILDDSGKMIGSTLHLEFESREALEAHLQADPYISGRVWKTLDIHPVKLVEKA